MNKILFGAVLVFCMFSVIPLGIAFSSESAPGAVEKNLSECLTYDDYEKCADEIKKKIEKTHAPADTAALYYDLAKTRIEELKFLADKNDIESVRLYMDISDAYYSEALDSLDKASQGVLSTRMKLDTLFLKFLIYRKKFDIKKQEALFNEIANKIADFSDDNKENKRQLDRISYWFTKNALPEHALRIKVLYAEKAPRQSGIEVAGDIKKEADRLFAEQKFKEADALYKCYFAVARKISGEDATASATLKIADKYFETGKYTQALGYYREYLSEYPQSRLSDYCAYRIGLCLYLAKNYPAAVRQLDSFLKEHPGSKWFDDGFENLSRIRYEDKSPEKAVENLKTLIAEYNTAPARQFAEFLIGLLYFDTAKYKKAAKQFAKFKTEYPDSIYSYAARRLMNEMENINEGNSSTLASVTDDAYRTWEPHTPLKGKISAKIKGKEVSLPLENIKPGTRICFTLDSVKDLDKCGVYLYDPGDMSRLPRKIDDEVREDLLSVRWSSDDGCIESEKYGLTKVWQAPDKPGTYRISASVGDLALIRPPDEGTRKDSEPLEMSITVTVGE